MPATTDAQTSAALPDEPAVSDAMRATVLERLREVEQAHQVHVLYACESGSRGWGFASPDSDYDVRFIYVHRLPWYLTVESGRDVIELPIEGDLDINGWELRKALQLMQASNPALMEWLRSPIVYRQEATWAAQLQALAAQAFSDRRGYHHYASMAKKNFREYLQGDTVRLKKYLYVLRPLLAVHWIRSGYGLPPVRFDELLARTVHDPALLLEIEGLLTVKRLSGEAAYGPRLLGIHAFIEEALTSVAAPGADLPDIKGDRQMLDAFLFDAVLQFNDVQQR